MPICRVTLKKTRCFPKGSAVSSSSIGKYLRRYMDQGGKGQLTHPESPGVGGGTEACCSLRDGVTGKIYTGGFLGEATSPGSADRGEQLEWCLRIAKIWDELLRPRTRRLNDGFRCVLCLGPRAVDDLKTNGISTDAALRDIWKQSMALYQKRQGWNNRNGELAWLCGGHPGSYNTPLHIILFPTTRSGDPLHINLKKTSSPTEHHLTEMIAMVNIAAEMYWRNRMGIEYQTQEYQAWLQMFPETEPPLPGLYDYVRNGKIQPRRDERPVKPKFNLRTVSKEILEDTTWQLGQKKIVKRQPRRGLRLLTSRTIMHQVFDKLTTSILYIMHNLLKKPKECSELLINEFPDENDALTALQTALAESPSKAARELAAHWEKSQAQRTWSLIELALGMNHPPPREFIHNIGIQQAKEFENMQTTLTPPKLPKAWAIRHKWKVLSDQTKIRHHRYRAARRVIASKLGTQSQEARILSKLIRGAERLVDIHDTRREELEAIIQKKGNMLELRIEERSWNLENGKMVLKPGQGAPWPAHFDAATVFQSLEDNASVEPTIEIDRGTADLKTAVANRKPDQESMLGRMIRVFRMRCAQLKQISMEINGPEIGGWIGRK